MNQTFRHVVALTLLVGLVACNKKEETPPKQIEPVVQVETGPDAEQQIAAMLRSHPNSRRICVDGLRIYTFFLDYGPLLSPNAEEDGRWHGWMFIEKVDFYKTSNNTWFIFQQDEKKYFQAYPDVSGLTCKAQ